MSIKKIYLGDFNNEVKDKLLNKSIDYLKDNKGNKFLYILPNGSLLVKYRNLLIDSVEKTNEINIFTFDDIAEILAKSVNLKLISEKTKEILLKDIIEILNNYGELIYYKNISSKDGFIKNISSIISSIKSSLIKSEEYNKSIDDEDNSFKEIGYIYKEYTKVLEKYNLMDAEDKFLHTIEGLKENHKGFLKDIDFIIIDEFYDFRPQELEIIKEISKLDLDIYINMPFNRENNFKSLVNSVDSLKKYKFELEIVDKNNKNYFEELSNNIFTNKKIELNENIYLIKSPTKEIEIKKIAELIKKEYKNGTELNEMAVVVTSDNYKTIINKIFQEEKIPSSNNINIEISKIPIVRELYNLLNYINESNKENFINRIKSKYFNVSDEEYIEILELNIREKSLNLEEFRNIYLSEILNLERDNIFEKLDLEKDLFESDGSIKYFSEILLKIIDSYNLEEKIFEIYKNTNNYELLYRDLSTLKQIKDGLENILGLEDIIFNKINLEEFIKIYYEFLESQSLNIKEGNTKGVDILTPSTARGYKYKNIFIIGLSQGEYPSLSTKNFFFKDENSNIFKNIGLEYRNYYERLDKESLNFSIVLSQTLEKLYLSYSENILDNESSIPSIFLDELLYCIDGKINEINLDLDYLIKKSKNDITTRDDLFYYILNKEVIDNKELIKLNITDKEKFENIVKNSKCEYKRSIGFDKYSGILEDEDIIKDIAKKSYNKSYSISYLENYGRCPYYFMLKNLLRIDDINRELEEFTKLDRGKINHKILQDFYTVYIENIVAYVINDIKIDSEDIKKYLLDRYYEELEKINIDIEGSIYKLKAETNVNKVLEFILFDLERLKNYKDKILPVELEKEFGREEDFYIEIDNKKIKFTGVIDRVDKFVDEEKYLIMDYKNSVYGIATSEQIFAGTSLQMPVYIMSQKDKNIVGALYGIISNQDIDILLIEENEKSIIGRRKKGIYSKEKIEEILDISKQYIGEYIDNISNGYFPVNPKECSSFCEYKNICRVKKDLEV